ncbi:helix-turn-helix transcriptional regulator [Erwinia sp. V71]|uniref:helix-turn-helix transcriptional regulator n=1 Tax=Erwinia sp. V71 TaxID=3369424 RepID=UPI003F5F6E1E
MVSLAIADESGVTTAPPAWSSPLARSYERRDLFAVAWPRLKSIQHTQAFQFFDTTFLLILSGELQMTTDGTTYTLNSSSGLCMVDAGICADLSKFPAPQGLFQSIFLTLKPAVIERFQRHYPSAANSKPSAPIRTLAADDDLRHTLDNLLASAAQPDLSDPRLELRIVDFMLALSERGVSFTTQQNSTAARLKTLLRDAPDQHWTARSAGTALAMSEATLRRRLSEEGIRFEHILLDIRMHHALMLLQTTAWSIPQIADACGYRSQARFSERFRDRFGISPARVR